MNKTYLKDLTPDEVIRRLKAGEVLIDELKLEVGKCYKTRDGRKAFISFKTKDCFCGAVAESPDLFDWSENGKYMYKENEVGYDLISEWSDDDVAEK